MARMKKTKKQIANERKMLLRLMRALHLFAFSHMFVDGYARAQASTDGTSQQLSHTDGCSACAKKQMLVVEMTAMLNDRHAHTGVIRENYTDAACAAIREKINRYLEVVDRSTQYHGEVKNLLLNLTAPLAVMLSAINNGERDIEHIRQIAEKSI